MTSDVQFEEEWFTMLSVKDARELKALKEEREEREKREERELKALKEEREKREEREEKEKREEKERGAKEDRIHQKIEELQALVYQQSEMIQILAGEIKELKSTTYESASQNDRTHQLLDELKRVKERELNYALRCHHPVPFFDSESLARLVTPLPSHVLSRKPL